MAAQPRGRSPRSEPRSGPGRAVRATGLGRQDGAPARRYPGRGSRRGAAGLRFSSRRAGAGAAVVCPGCGGAPLRQHRSDATLPTPASDLPRLPGWLAPVQAAACRCRACSSRMLFLPGNSNSTQWCTIRSTTAVAVIGFLNTFSHSLKARLVVMKTLRCFS